MYSLEGDYAALPLPAHQDIILTSSFAGLQDFVQGLLKAQERTGGGQVGIVSGESGTGKTVAGRAFFRDLEPRPDSYLPRSIWIDLLPYLAKATLIRRTLIKLEGEPLRKAGKLPTAQELVKAIKNNGIELIILDNADQLNRECLELMEEVYVSSQTTLVFLSLPETIPRIWLSEKFKAAAKYFKFEMLGAEEIMDQFLPNLVIPRWDFDPHCAADRDLGQYLCQQEDLSLLRLRLIIQMASLIAERDGVLRINHSTLKEVVRLFSVPEEP